MDGRIRPRALVAVLVVVASSSLGGSGSAEDVHKRLPRNSPLFVSSYLEEEFLGAVSLDLRVDTSAGAVRHSAELELFSKNSAKSPKFKSTIVRLSLAQIPGSNSSQGEDPPAQARVSYVVSGMPAELIKSGETLQLELTSASGDGERAQLTLYGSDGKPRRDIKLTQVKLPKAPINLESEKDDSPR